MSFYSDLLTEIRALRADVAALRASIEHMSETPQLRAEIERLRETTIPEYLKRPHRRGIYPIRS